MDASDANEFDLIVFEGLQTVLNATNPFVRLFHNARDRLYENGNQNLHVRILYLREGRQYAKPTTNEVATIIVGDESEITRNRDIMVKKLDGNLQRINETHPSYMSLQYSLLFPYGSDGWTKFIKFAPGSNYMREGISIREFYAFRLMSQDAVGTSLLQGGRLFQQFVVDCYAAIEQERLSFIKNNQNALCADLYRGLQDAVNAGDTDATAVINVGSLSSKIHSITCH